MQSNVWATFLSSLIVGVVVAVLAVALAGRRFQNEEQAKQVKEARDRIRRMTSDWIVDIRMFVAGQRGLPEIADHDFELFRLCSAVIEASRSLPWSSRVATLRACRILFGKQFMELARETPATAYEGVSGFMFHAAIFDRAIPGPGASRQYEMGHFGVLLNNYRAARLDGYLSFAGVPQMQGTYKAASLLYYLSILSNIRGYHMVVLSTNYERLRTRLVTALNRLRAYSERNVPTSDD